MRFNAPSSTRFFAGAPPPQPASDNLRTLAITFAAYEASRRGCPVAIDE